MTTSSNSSAVMAHIKRLEKARQEGAMEVEPSGPTPRTNRRGSNEGDNNNAKQPGRLNDQTPSARLSGRKFGSNTSGHSTGEESPSAANTSKTPPWKAGKALKPTDASNGPPPESAKPKSKYPYSLPSKPTIETGKSNTTSNSSSGRVSKPSSPSAKQADDATTGNKPLYSLPRKTALESKEFGKGTKDAEPPKSYGGSKHPYAVPSKEKATTTKPEPPLNTKESNSSTTRTSSSLPSVALKATNSAAAAELKRQKEVDDLLAEELKATKSAATPNQRTSSLPPLGSMKKATTTSKMDDGAINDHVKRLRETSTQSQQTNKNKGTDSDPYVENYLKRVGDQRQKVEQSKKSTDSTSNDRTPRRGSNEKGTSETEDMSKAVADKKKWLKNLTHEIVAERSQWLEEEKSKATKEKESPPMDLGSSLSRLPMYDANDLMQEIHQSSVLLDAIKQKTAFDVQSVDTLTLGGLTLVSRDTTDDEATQDNQKSTVDTVKEETDDDEDGDKGKDDSNVDDSNVDDSNVDDSNVDDSNVDDDDDDDDDDEEEEESEEVDSDEDEEEKDEEDRNQDSAELEAAMLAGLKRAEQDAAPYQVKTDPPEQSSKDEDDEESEENEDEEEESDKNSDDSAEEVEDDEDEEEQGGDEKEKEKGLGHNNVAAQSTTVTRDLKVEPDENEEEDDGRESSKELDIESKQNQDKEFIGSSVAQAPPQPHAVQGLARADVVKGRTYVAKVDEQSPVHELDDDGEKEHENETEADSMGMQEKRDKHKEKKRDKKSKKDRDHGEKKKKKKDKKKEKKESKKKDKKKDKKDKKREKRGSLSSVQEETESNDMTGEVELQEGPLSEQADAAKGAADEPSLAVDRKESDVTHDDSTKGKKESATTEAEMAKAADQSGCGCVIL